MWVLVYVFREAGATPKDDTDIFAERRDPNALKVCDMLMFLYDNKHFLDSQSHLRESLFLNCFGESSLLDFHLSICSLQEHLLKMTTEHRAEMALKRRKPAAVEEGW